VVKSQLNHKITNELVAIWGIARGASPNPATLGSAPHGVGRRWALPEAMARFRSPGEPWAKPGDFPIKTYCGWASETRVSPVDRW